jgi:hypothetical protein
MPRLYPAVVAITLLWGFRGALCPNARAEGPELVSVTKIWDQAPHNAFTDLIRWRGKWYCAFRDAEVHVGGDGKLRVLESSDGQAWQPAALIAEAGIDLRDPKLSVAPDDRLILVAGGSVYRGTTLLGRQPRVAFSKDGRDWTPPQRVLAEGDWLWRVTWHERRAYGVSYNAAARPTKEAQEAAKRSEPISACAPPPANWSPCTPAWRPYSGAKRRKPNRGTMCTASSWPKAASAPNPWLWPAASPATTASATTTSWPCNAS